ncbi:hypothetical protein [Arsenophonus nasoniae]|uniref:Uncharacterized protein n=1 Tax=Arsenophonus nasoniae TaxID=638 RepID=A0AA95GCN7_9GAMM|nr:hypothetical protein [Arsenophonus nasoniae]WGL93745.1 hypothetical protein QE207_00335 [Arsenophonus nasoniae]WGL96043.1 hypothetical protein QE207_05510 [Arsenophonus nasoniae]
MAFVIPVFKIYHDGGEIDNILDSFGFVIHSEQVDFKKTSFQFDQRFLKGGRKIVAVPRIDIARNNNNYPAIENVNIYGNTVSWNYTNFCIGCATIPVIHVFKLT